MGPRLFGIPAREADVVAVIRRGPSGWCQVSRWEPASDTFHEGAWLHGTIYPQRCDLSPDGRWLAYFALKSGSRWNVGDTYLAISRLPWLAALAAWSTCGTWTSGIHFTADRRNDHVGLPDVGDLEQLHRRYGLAATRPQSFSVERRTGWLESAASPARSADDMWDERRADELVMQKQRPGDPGMVLHVKGGQAAFRSSAPAWTRARYWLEDGGGVSPLDDVQWADWSRGGQLLVATTDGALEIRTAPFGLDQATGRHDLGPLRPDPQAPPAEAHRW